MYESRFGITGLPFQLSPDPDFYFDSRGHHRALAELRRGLSLESGFIVISGEIGAGKTTLVRSLIGELAAESLAVAHIVSTQLDADELIRSASIGFGIPIDGAAPKVLVTRLLRFLVDLDKQSRRALLIIDEAQNLHRDAFDQLLSIVARRAPWHLPLQVCLLGQPELRGMIEAADLSGLRQLVCASCHLGPIERDEVGDYIEHRLRKVGWGGVPDFEPAAFDEIFRWTAGVPRRINLLANRLMLSRFLAGETTIRVATVTDTAREVRAEIGEQGGEPPALKRGRAPTPLVAPASGSAQLPRLQMELGGSAEPPPLLCVAASLGDHVRAAALMGAMAARADLPAARLVRVSNDDALHLSRGLFERLDVERRAIGLDIAPGPLEARMLQLANTFDLIVDHVRPRALIVFDGSDEALACAKVARAHAVPIVHIGAGLRVAGRPAQAAARKPLDELADLLCTADPQASQTLADEGVPAGRVHCVGNLLIDAVLLALRPAKDRASGRLGAATGPFLGDRDGYAMVVVGAPVNVGERQALMEVLTVLRDASRDIPLVWPMHAEVESQLKKHRLDGLIAADRISRLPAQPYVDHVALMRSASCVLTDSWDVQEEATALGVPCFTVGVYPHRSITVTTGSNVVVGVNRALATRLLWDCIFNGGKAGRVPELWDGKAGSRIAGHLSTWLGSAGSDRAIQRSGPDPVAVPTA